MTGLNVKWYMVHAKWYMVNGTGCRMPNACLPSFGGLTGSQGQCILIIKQIRPSFSCPVDSLFQLPFIDICLVP